jgi:hypothetical protein
VQKVDAGLLRHLDEICWNNTGGRWHILRPGHCDGEWQEKRHKSEAAQHPSA